MHRKISLALFCGFISAIAAACGSSDDDSNTENNDPSGSGGSSGGPDPRCSMTLCPNDSQAMVKEQCDNIVGAECWTEWQALMNCNHENEVCLPSGFRDSTSVQSCIDMYQQALTDCHDAQP